MTADDEGRPPAKVSALHTDDRDDVNITVAPCPRPLADWATATRDRRAEQDRRALDGLVRRDAVRRAPIQVQPRRPRDLDAERSAFRDGYGKGWADAVAAMRARAGAE
jgi:hypothetical protein